jgi:hypothetical protein
VGESPLRFDLCIESGQQHATVPFRNRVGVNDLVNRIASANKEPPLDDQLLLLPMINQLGSPYILEMPAGSPQPAIQCFRLKPGARD